MGTNNTINTGGKIERRFTGGGVGIGGNPTFDRKKDPYSYGFVIDNSNSDRSITYRPIGDNISPTKVGKAVPFHANNIQLPGIGEIVPLLKGPDRVAGAFSSQYEQITYYLNPVTVNQNVFDNTSIPGGAGGEGGVNTSMNSYNNNNIGLIEGDRHSIENLGIEWQQIAANFISRMEGFAKKAAWDQNAYRGGYGTDKKLVNGVLIDVSKDPNTTWTKEEAVATLAYELPNTYAKSIIGNIGRDNWNKLNDNQKAAYLSFAYNCGPGRSRDKIKAALNNNDINGVATIIANGPVTGAGTKKVYKGLVERRKLESALFLKPVST